MNQSPPDTKVFVSWSGKLSYGVAELLANWIPDVLQGTKVWISHQDIEKGSLWFDEIQNALKEVGAGILCVTRGNSEAPWLLFEAGALSKGLSRSRVCPLLIDLKPSDLRAPLSHFNCAQITKSDVRKLLGMINKQRLNDSLQEERIDKSFEKWRPDFESKLATLLNSEPAETAPQRNANDMLEEIMDTVRSLDRHYRDLPTYIRLRIKRGKESYTAGSDDDGEEIEINIEDQDRKGGSW